MDAPSDPAPAPDASEYMTHATHVASSIARPSSSLPLSLFDPMSEQVMRPPPWHREPRATSTASAASTTTATGNTRPRRRQVWKRHERAQESIPDAVVTLHSPGKKAVKKIAFTGDDDDRKSRGRRGKVWALPVVSTPGKGGLRHKSSRVEILETKLDFGAVETTKAPREEDTRSLQIGLSLVIPEVQDASEEHVEHTTGATDQIADAEGTAPSPSLRERAKGDDTNRTMVAATEDARFSTLSDASSLLLEALISPVKKSRRSQRRNSAHSRKSRRKTIATTATVEFEVNVTSVKQELVAPLQKCTTLNDATLPKTCSHVDETSTLLVAEAQQTVEEDAMDLDGSSAPETQVTTQNDNQAPIEDTVTEITITATEISLPTAQEQAPEGTVLELDVETTADSLPSSATIGSNASEPPLEVTTESTTSIINTIISSPERNPPAQTDPPDSKSYLEYDTEMLMDFLDRAKASKAAKIAKRSSISNKRDSNAVQHALASPRKPLDDLDVNTSVSATETTHEGTPEDIPSSPLQDRVEEPIAVLPVAADSTVGATKSSQRRSTRIALPKTSFTTTPVPLQIALRRLPEADRIPPNTAHKRTEAAELASATRINTKRNKGGSMAPRTILAKIKAALSGHESVLVDAAIEAATEEQALSQRKGVQWDDNTRIKIFHEGDLILIAADGAIVAPSTAPTNTVPRRSNLTIKLGCSSIAQNSPDVAQSTTAPAESVGPPDLALLIDITPAAPNTQSTTLVARDAKANETPAAPPPPCKGHIPVVVVAPSSSSATLIKPLPSPAPPTLPAAATPMRVPSTLPAAKTTDIPKPESRSKSKIGNTPRLATPLAPAPPKDKEKGSANVNASSAVATSDTAILAPAKPKAPVGVSGASVARSRVPRRRVGAAAAARVASAFKSAS